MHQVLPACIDSILTQELWKNVRDKEGNTFASFRDFVEYPLWHGLELPFDKLLMYCKDDRDPELHKRLLREIKPSSDYGRNRYSRDDNIISSEQGTSSSYIIRRLLRDDPALAQRVIDGELSAHKAAIQAGFRKRMLQVHAGDCGKAVAKLVEHYGEDEIRRVLDVGGPKAP